MGVGDGVEVGEGVGLGVTIGVSKVIEALYFIDSFPAVSLNFI